MFILVPAKGISARFIISKSIERIKEHLEKEYGQGFIYDDYGTAHIPKIAVYKDVSSKKFNSIRAILENVYEGKILMGYIQNMNEFEV
jgi:hypothetical protein